MHILAGVWTFLLLCAGVARSVATEGAGDGLTPLCLRGEGGVVICSLATPASTFFTKRGRIGSAVTTKSGERIEIRWNGILPRYELRYYSGRDHGGVTVGRCHYRMGCNRVVYEGSAGGEEGGIEGFTVLRWESYDFASPEGHDGHLERHRHVFHVPSGRHVVYRELLPYACGPPVAFYPYPCATVCDPPYRVEEKGGTTTPVVVSSEVVLDEVVR